MVFVSRGLLLLLNGEIFVRREKNSASQTTPMRREEKRREKENEAMREKVQTV